MQYSSTTPPISRTTAQAIRDLSRTAERIDITAFLRTEDELRAEASPLTLHRLPGGALVGYKHIGGVKITYLCTARMGMVTADA